VKCSNFLCARYIKGSHNGCLIYNNKGVRGCETRKAFNRIYKASPWYKKATKFLDEKFKAKAAEETHD